MKLKYVCMTIYIRGKLENIKYVWGNWPLTNTQILIQTAVWFYMCVCLFAGCSASYSPDQIPQKNRHPKAQWWVWLKWVLYDCLNERTHPKKNNLLFVMLTLFYLLAYFILSWCILSVCSWLARCPLLGI